MLCKWNSQCRALAGRLQNCDIQNGVDCMRMTAGIYMSIEAWGLLAFLCV